MKLLTDDKLQHSCQHSWQHSCHLIYDPVVFRGMEQWLKYKEICITERKQEMKIQIERDIMKGKVVFPCMMSIIPHYIFMKGGSDDIMLGVKILNGKLFSGTPLSCNGLELGRVIRIEKDKKAQSTANPGDEVCIRIENKNKYTYDKNFTFQHSIVSAITRESIDTLKMHYKDEMTPDDWALVILLMKKLNIPMKKAT
jgi:translation initiation factor IF-2